MNCLGRITGFIIWSTGLLFTVSINSYGAVKDSASIDSNIMTQINAQIEAEQYQIRATGSKNNKSNSHDFRAYNITQDYGIDFSPDQVTIKTAQNNSAPPLTFKLNGWGYQNQLMPAGSAEVKTVGTRIEYQRPSITEWYNNTTLGLEQGFTLHRRPSNPGQGPIQVSIALDQSLNYRIDQHGQALIASDDKGKDLYRYDHLLAWDSNQKYLAANLQLTSTNELVIAVNDDDAIYPITIDPLISNIDHVFRGTYSSRKNDYGRSVAVDGDIAVVGAPRDERLDRFHGSGAVYVYGRDQGGTNNWGLIKKIAPNILRPGDEFGASVALSGDFLVVGAPKTDGLDGT